MNNEGLTGHKIMSELTGEEQEFIRSDLKKKYDAYLAAVVQTPFNAQSVKNSILAFKELCDHQKFEISYFCWKGFGAGHSMVGLLDPIFGAANRAYPRIILSRKVAWPQRYQVFEMLLEAGVDPHVRSKAGIGGSHLMMDVVQTPSETVGEWIDLLLRFGADIDHEKDQSFALKKAITGPYVTAAKHLVKRGAGVKVEGQRRVLALLEPAIKAHIPELVDTLKELKVYQKAWCEKQELSSLLSPSPSSQQRVDVSGMEDHLSESFMGQNSSALNQDKDDEDKVKASLRASLKKVL